MNALAFLALVLASIPAAMFAINLIAYRRLPNGPVAGGPHPSPSSVPAISVLIPARNEASTLDDAMASILDQRSAEFEVIVLDDHSTDGTSQKVQAWSARDPRVRWVQSRPLPAGWCGKQHACWQLAGEARHDIFLFLDADVRLAPGALSRLAAFLASHPHLHLISGVPRQRTGTFLERLLIPLIHFILLGYLPLPAARRWSWKAFAAGCGQWMVTRRDAYFAADGHRAVRASLHDGVTLPRAFRAAGWQTDVFDATDLAHCRMYHSAREVWRGLGKNATEGMAHPAAILPWTVLLVGGHVLPWVLLFLHPRLPFPGLLMASAAAILSGLPRIAASVRFQQPVAAAFLHPVAILVLVVLQWSALVTQWLGRPQQWRGRSYAGKTRAAADSRIAP